MQETILKQEESELEYVEGYTFPNGAIYTGIIYYLS